MVNSKNKGKGWERDATKLLNEAFGEDSFKRVPGSGAFGTQLNESDLSSDIKGNLPFTPKPFRIECKVGYGGAKSMTVYKEWFDKVAEEARKALAIPFVMAKFSGAREGTRYFIAMDFDVFVELLERANYLKEQLDSAYGESDESEN